jgi:hypothetical protein
VFYGIIGKAYTSIKSYLEDRHQRVILKDKYFKSCSNWGVIKHGVPQGSILGPLLFLLYINDLSKITNNKNNNNKSKSVPFADDTSIIVTNPKPIDFIKDINMTFKNINEWFKANLLSLNFDKTFIQFITKNSSRTDDNIGCDNFQYFQLKVFRINN